MVATYFAAPNLETGHVATYTAGAAIAANTLVKLSTTEGSVINTAAITDIAIGVALNTCASGDQCQVQVSGVAKVLTTAVAIATVGTQVMPAAAGGGLIEAAAGATAVSVGLTEQAATGSDVIKVRICCPNLKAPANA
jgi:hypothetical protein